MFKFTFNVGGSAPTNPFAAQAEVGEPQTVRRKLPAPPRRPSPGLPRADEVPRPRKRGWVPTSSSASQAASQPTLTSGWIDTPAKYLAQASRWQGGSDEDQDNADADLPPAKRRRTLADSVISTAFSAALIGTAVGMTAYRMWRDRGKSSQESPHVDAPPPYQREEWADDVQPRAQPPGPGATSRLHKKPRPAARRVPRHRRTPIAISPARSPVRVVSPTNFTPAKQEERINDQGELDDQMDWMGDRIRQLIEEGQKALGKEIVIKTDEQNDEDEGAIDDGMDGWEEDQDPNATRPPVASSSRTPGKPFIPTSSSPLTPHSYTFPASDSSTPTLSPKRSLYAAGGSHAETSLGLGSPCNGNPLGTS